MPQWHRDQEYQDAWPQVLKARMAVLALATQDGSRVARKALRPLVTGNPCLLNPGECQVLRHLLLERTVPEAVSQDFWTAQDQQPGADRAAALGLPYDVGHRDDAVEVESEGCSPVLVPARRANGKEKRPAKRRNRGWGTGDDKPVGDMIGHDVLQVRRGGNDPGARRS